MKPIPHIVAAIAVLAAISEGSAPVAAGVLPLNVLAANDSTFYEYFSDGFFRMDLFSPTRPTNQSFHQISNPDTIYNQNFDGFPNDRQFRFGQVVYDETGLTGGTGLAPITDLTFNMAADPANPSYLNWRRFNVNTIFDDEDELEGTVELVDNRPVGVTLSADFEFEAIGALGATITGYYPGTLEFDGDQFTLTAEGMPVLDTVFGTAEFHLKWDFSGQLHTLVPDAGDYTGDDLVDGADFLSWQATLGNSVEPAGAGADGDSSGTVDAPDLAIWQENFGFGLVSGATPATAAIPEPATGVLALANACGAIAAAHRARNHGARRTR